MRGDGVVLRQADPDPHDSRVPWLDSINGGIPYPCEINPREGEPTSVGWQTSPQGALPGSVPVPQLTVSHVPVRGRSSAKQAESVDLSTDIFHVIPGLNNEGQKRAFQ